MCIYLPIRAGRTILTRILHCRPMNLNLHLDCQITSKRG